MTGHQEGNRTNRIVCQCGCTRAKHYGGQYTGNPTWCKIHRECKRYRQKLPVKALMEV